MAVGADAAVVGVADGAARRNLASELRGRRRRLLRRGAAVGAELGRLREHLCRRRRRDLRTIRCAIVSAVPRAWDRLRGS